MRRTGQVVESEDRGVKTKEAAVIAGREFFSFSLFFLLKVKKTFMRKS